MRGTGINIMLKKESFIKNYGGIYEHSPWIAEAAYETGNIGTFEMIHAAMKEAVTGASHEQKLALIKAHPDLACAEKMTEDSVFEQKGAGLDQCSADEFAEFRRLNTDYKKKFGFPFIIAVKGLTRTDILQAFRNRIRNNPADEFETALDQIHRIGWFRLKALN